MLRTRFPASQYYNIVSPLLPFYALGLTPRQMLWPIVFLPLILVASFAWTLVLVTVAVLALGEAEQVGQHALVRFAIWTTVGGLMIDISHDVSLNWLTDQVDFLLEERPWRMLGSSYLVPCTLILLYDTLMAWQYLRLRLPKAVLVGLTLALLTAPWTTLMVLDLGQGRLPGQAQWALWLGIAGVVAGLWLLALGGVVIRRVRGLGQFLVVLVVVGLAGLSTGGGAISWTRAMFSTAAGPLGASGLVGEVAFVARGRVYAMQAGGGGNRSLGALSGSIIGWSPNARFLLAQEERADGTTVLVMLSTGQSAAGGVVVGSGRAGHSAWAPDSTGILYVLPKDNTSQILWVRADGSGSRVLAEGQSPSWSPDGKRIAYASRLSGRWQVWVMLPDGSDPIQLTTEGGEDPVWSPDGRFIAYVYNNRVYVMDADGANKRRLPVDSAFADTRPHIVWSPDGQRLAYIYVYPTESGRATQLHVWETTSPATPVGGTPTPTGLRPTPTAQLAARTGEFRPPFAWAPDGVWMGFVRRGYVWALNTRTGEERRLGPGESFAWNGTRPAVAVRPVPTYPPTPTPTPLPPTIVEMPSVLVLSPRDPTIIFAGAAPGVIKQMGSGGWFLSNTGIVYPTKVRVLVFDPVNASIMYAGTDGERTVAGALYRSVDGGNRWAVTGLKDVDVYQLAIDPRQPTVMFAGTSKGVYASSDGGATWAPRNSGLKSTTVQALTLDPKPTKGVGQGTPVPLSQVVLYAGTRAGELYKSANGGEEWRLVQSGNTAITSIVIHDRKPGLVFVTTEEGLLRSTDNGDTWGQVSGGIWKTRLSGLLLHPKDADVIYAYGSPGVFVSHDGGGNWGPASSGLEGTQPSALVIHPKDTSVLYVGTDKGVYRTANGGVTWSR